MISYLLAFILFVILIVVKGRSARENKRLRDEIRNLNQKNRDLQKNCQLLSESVSRLTEAIESKDEIFESLKNENDQTFVRISSLYSDFMLVQYDISSKYLEFKKHPAKKEAARIKELKVESKAYLEQYRQMFYRYEYLLELFPELSEYVDDLETLKQLDEVEDLKTFKNDFDRTQFYLSKDEYSALSTNERNQLALDRYVSGQKSKWQIGRDYELYCGLKYEEKGWEVEYTGMEKKLEDLGRDLIARSKNEHHIIQCKLWSKHKTIHEKHITQLFGTSVEYDLSMPAETKVTPVFMTNIELSPQAKRFADRLGVKVIEKFPLQEFPRIKCNLNRDEDGFESKIYHLPFDQQYDRTKINKTGEFYALTVQQAVDAGFRRAYRYFGG